MAHFAQLDENNVVIWVTSVDNSIITDENGVEQEELGVQHLLNTIPGAENCTWKQTSYNHNFRFNYAGIGYTYDETLDAFIAPKPCDSWILNETTLVWESPTPIPDPENGHLYYWNEETLSWELNG